MQKSILAAASLVVAIAFPVGTAIANSGQTGGSNQTGLASYYGSELHGRKTASGERFNQYQLTAAHRSAPFGTRYRVTNLSTQRSVVVRVNDRGPFVRGRIIDLSSSAAKAIGMHGRGVGRVRIERI
jgi:rare lipoprotein A